MSQQSEKFDLQAALADPGLVFVEPKAIVDSKTLSRKTKIKLLQQWERDARGLSVAENEGMGGGEENMLGRVLRALSALGAIEPPDVTE